MENKEVSQVIFDYIKSIGFKPYNIKYGNGYFLFEMGENSVVHFSIKGLFGWKFAMWLDLNENESSDNDEQYPALQFFAQHKENIDKFKPSRSFFCEKYNLNELKDIDKDQFCFYKIKNIIKMIKKHPFISFYHDLFQYHNYIDDSCIKWYFKQKIGNFYDKLKKYINDWFPILWIKFKLLFCGKNSIINEIEIIDGNTKAFTSYPRWDVDFLFNEDSTDQLESEYLNKWFRWNPYNVNFRFHRIGVEGYYDFVYKDD